MAKSTIRVCLSKKASKNAGLVDPVTGTTISRAKYDLDGKGKNAKRLQFQAVEHTSFVRQRITSGDLVAFEEQEPVEIEPKDGLTDNPETAGENKK
jgi:hypothetical protein